MHRTADDALAEAIDGLADLAEHLTRAQEVLSRLPLADKLTDGEHRLPGARVFKVAQLALQAVVDFAHGHRRAFPSGVLIDLSRSDDDMQLSVLGQPSPAEVASFVAELRASDRRFAASAELLGVLLGLSAKWTAASFAPFLVLHTLSEHGPRILELGSVLLDEAATNP